jgi:predicted nucleotidyltransferase
VGDLIAIYIFGSVGRGEHDERSDLDILAVVRNRSGKVKEGLVLTYIPKHLTLLKPSISWYGRERIAEMYHNGELFAWHLYRETVAIFEQYPFLATLGEPKPYRDGAVDVRSFQKILQGIPDQVALNLHNAIYETGLIYVCLRNITMAASWSLCNKPDFSRYSPFRLNRVSTCPISLEQYEIAMTCRMSGQRGLPPPPQVNAEFTLKVYERLFPWIEEIRLTVSQEAAIEQQHETNSV